MNKNIFLLTVLLLLVPSCGKKTQVYSPGPATVVSEQVVSPETAEYDKELDAYVVKEDENKFSAEAAARANQEDELKAARSEATPEDFEEHSEKYGLKRVFFRFNKYMIQGDEGLTPDQMSALKHDLAIVRSLAGKHYRIAIEGHACNSDGSTEYNLMLSEDRAKAVQNYFIEQGVPGAANFDIKGHGCQHLIVPTGNAEQQAPNRRVEIFAYPPEAA